MAKVGRPRKETFDIKQAYECGRVGLSYEVMGHLFGLSKTTIQRRMKEDDGKLWTEYKRGQSDTNRQLRSVLIARARTDKNPVCLLFALKNFCGMSDKPEEQKEEGSAPLLARRKLKNGAVVWIQEGTDVSEFES